MEFEIDIEGEENGGTGLELNLYMMVGIVVLIAIIVFALVASSLKKKGKVNGGMR